MSDWGILVTENSIMSYRMINDIDAHVFEFIFVFSLFAYPFYKMRDFRNSWLSFLPYYYACSYQQNMFICIIYFKELSSLVT